MNSEAARQGRPAPTVNRSDGRVADGPAGHAPATPLQVALQLVASAFETVRGDEQAYDWLCEVAAIRVSRGFREQLDRRAAA